MKKTIVLIVLLISFKMFSQENILFPNAKFKTGDNSEWKNNDLDDSNWATIKTTIVFENQGFEKYDGYCWYRITFFLPNTLKNNSAWKEGLSFVLNRIDDADETYLNGNLIGKTGAMPTDEGGASTAWATYRTYNVLESSNFIKWDQENVLAIRVSDFGGNGGMFSKMPFVRMIVLDDIVTMDFESNDNQNFKSNYNATIKNVSEKVLNGHWTLNFIDSETNKTVKTTSKNISIKPSEKHIEPIIVEGETDKRLTINSVFEETKTGTKINSSFILPYILTPKPSDAPRINSVKVFGVKPNSPILFKVAATGKNNLLYQAKNIPIGVKLDSKTGMISGKVAVKGDYKIQFIVSNKFGKATQDFTLKIGNQIALTPPMGWNSWNCWGISVNNQKVRSSAQAFIDKGLINHGWNYVNIDDGWEIADRDANGNITGNEKFPDMKKLGHFLHQNGMKFGIYSSPGTKTCGTYLGSYNYEENDAATYANWGIDYLKYDWCSYDAIFDKEQDTSLAAYQKPYKTMQIALQKQNRDIVYSLCQYGRKEVWKWGNEVSGNSWRTTDDINDTWESVLNTGFKQTNNAEYAKPSNWNDPDMLVVGQVGWSGALRPSRLTPDEQYSHVSLWCLLSSPLLLGCDVSKLDDFTLNLLTNDEVLAIDQDILGKQAIQKLKTNDSEIWIKELEDGSKAIGIFNMSEKQAKIKLNFSELGLNSDLEIRDLWRQKDLGVFKNNFETDVPPHGVILIKVFKK